MNWAFPKKHKYSAKRTEVDGYVFPSQGHAQCYVMLKLMEKAGDIKILKLEDSVRLSDAKIVYIADFRLYDVKMKNEWWGEFKGFETPVWRIKRKLWAFYGPGPLRIYKASGNRVYLHEEIIPKSQVLQKLTK